MATIRRPLDCFPALHTQSFDEARASIGEIFCPHALLPVSTARTLDMRLHHVGLADASVNYLEYGQDVQVVPSEFPDFYLLQITLAGANELHCGKEAVTSSRGVGTVTGPGQRLRLRWSDDCREIIFRFERGALEGHLAAQLGRPVSRSLQFDIALNLATGAGASVWRAAQYVVTELEQQGPAERLSPVTVQLEQLLMCTLLHGQSHNYSEALHREVPAAAPRFIQRAEAYMEAHCEDSITLEELTAVVGVGARTLQKGFRRYRGITPLQFFKQVRMERVREALRHADPRDDTVSRIALDYGFSQLGRFAAEYRQRFGESPSDTLHR